MKTTTLTLATLALLLGCNESSSPANADTDPMAEGGSDGDDDDDDDDDDDGHVPADGFDEPDAFGPVGMRRLTKTELRNTLTMVLETDAAELDPLLDLLPADSSELFDNDYSVQTPSQPLIEGMNKLAESLAENIAEDANRLASVFGCAPSGPSDEACLRTGATRLGRLLLRRPLSSAEADVYASFIAEAEAEDDFATAAAMVLEALLLDGEFIYRVEEGEPVDGDEDFVRLDDYELLSRMSFLLWGSGPSTELLDLADAGELSTPGGVYEIAETMVADQRALTQLQRMHAMWLGYASLPLAPQLADSLRNETDKLVERALVDRDWLSMFTATDTWLDETLSAHYDIALPDGQAGWVAYPDKRRGGLMSHGSVLAYGMKFSDTSPSMRGLGVWSRMLCNAVPPPPATVDTGVPPDGAGATACKTERYDMREKVECASCHEIIDGIGFGLENYGPAGEWRTSEPNNPDCDISGYGEIPSIGEFAGAGALGELLVETGQLEGCMMQNLYQFTIGRAPNPEDVPILDALTTSFEDDDDLVGVVLELVASDAFRHRRVGES